MSYVIAEAYANLPLADYSSGTLSVSSYSYTLSVTPSVNAVPEPGIWAMIGIGIVGMALVGRKKKIAAKDA